MKKLFACQKIPDIRLYQTQEFQENGSLKSSVRRKFFNEEIKIRINKITSRFITDFRNTCSISNPPALTKSLKERERR